MHSEWSASNGAETFVQPNPTPQFPGASHKRSTRMIKMFVHLNEPKRKIKGGSSSQKVVAKDMGQNRMIKVQIFSLGKRLNLYKRMIPTVAMRGGATGINIIDGESHFKGEVTRHVQPEGENRTFGSKADRGPREPEVSGD
jgi:hypothetical protein